MRFVVDLGGFGAGHDVVNGHQIEGILSVLVLLLFLVLFLLLVVEECLMCDADCFFILRIRLDLDLHFIFETQPQVARCRALISTE